MKRLGPKIKIVSPYVKASIGQSVFIVLPFFILGQAKVSLALFWPKYFFS